MKKMLSNEYGRELNELCAAVRAMAASGEYESAIEMTSRAMGEYPHAPHPHNLMGIMFEKLGDHNNAMKHFRAAWALDQGYLPARYNLNTYGTFRSSGICAFDESDLPRRGGTNIVHDENGIGQAQRRNT